MPDGHVIRCVEKVFVPGPLTRLIYRAAFAAPFAYQHNSDAILACFYRRRVAAAVLAASDLQIKIAEPLYTRYCRASRGWILAAEWVDGRGVRPLAADRHRARRWLSRRHAPPQTAEIEQLVALMHQAESTLNTAGLSGSGWQVAPRAMVSTANLLRYQDGYTIIDLESGIPAVLVPGYLVSAARLGSFPPFDDLDPTALRSWYRSNQRLLTFRVGPHQAAAVEQDIELLIEHTARWKAAELAPLRCPWRLLMRGGLKAYQQATIERWQRAALIDDPRESRSHRQRWKMRAIWWSLWLPSVLGIFLARLIGRRDTRESTYLWLTNSLYRRAVWHAHRDRCFDDWTAAGRLRPYAGRQRFWLHRALSIFPVSVHRALTDRQVWQAHLVTIVLFLFSRRYQRWLGEHRIEQAINGWVESNRLCGDEAYELRNDLCGNEVRTYLRGFGMHLVLKLFAPIIIPAKIGGLITFAASGNVWFLLPFVLTPGLRLAATTVNAWQSRSDGIRHREALAVSALPWVGSIAFPLQMYAARPELSTFLIRDAAAKIARRLPIYGGENSRVELAFIRAADFVLEALDIATSVAGARRLVTRAHRVGARDAKPKTRFGRWLDGQARQRMTVFPSWGDEASRRAA